MTMTEIPFSQTDPLVELLGILGNMTMTEIPFSQILTDYDLINFLKNHLAQILTDYDLINFLKNHLAQGHSEDDIILEIVIFIGTCVNDPKCAPIFANSDLVA
ncbi:hypothetical protein T484DRAFT_1845365, partial [Baffinella frigidus]